MPNQETKSGYWKSDDVSSKCDRCGVVFSSTIGKHHCRWCGGIFCTRCLGLAGIFDGGKTYVPVCHDCKANPSRHQCACGRILHPDYANTCPICGGKVCDACCGKNHEGTVVECNRCCLLRLEGYDRSVLQRDFLGGVENLRNESNRYLFSLKEKHELDLEKKQNLAASKISRQFRMHQAKKNLNLLRARYKNDAEMQKRMLRNDYLYRLSKKDMEALPFRKSKDRMTGVLKKGAREYMKDSRTGRMDLYTGPSSQFYFIYNLDDITEYLPDSTVEFYYRQLADKFWMESRDLIGRCWGLALLWLRNKVANQDSRPFYLWISGQYVNDAYYRQFKALETIDVMHGIQRFSCGPNVNGLATLQGYLDRYQSTIDPTKPPPELTVELKEKVREIFSSVPDYQLGDRYPLAITKQSPIDFDAMGLEENPFGWMQSRGKIYSHAVLGTLLIDPQQQWLDYGIIPFYLGEFNPILPASYRSYVDDAFPKFFTSFVQKCCAAYHNRQLHRAYAVLISTHTHAFALYHDVDLGKGYFFDPNYGVICYCLYDNKEAEFRFLTTMMRKFLGQYSSQPRGRDDPYFVWLEVKKSGSDTCG